MKTKNINTTKEHTPVMVEEALTSLNIKPDGIYVDGTFGRGGHSQAILNKLGTHGRLLVIDLDPDAILIATKLQEKDPRIKAFHGSFNQIKEFCQKANLGNTEILDGILLDLGVSSPQLTNPDKGFSFSNDGPLDMRMDPTKGEPAYKWLNLATKEELIKVIKEYGEEHCANKIAEAIVKARIVKPITTTLLLAEIIKKECPYAAKFKHPATKTFQAIRIFINQELLNLQQALPKAIELLKINGRLVVISFHSLEDRIVKNLFKEYSTSDLSKSYSNNYAIRKIPITNININKIKLKKISKLKPSIEEIKNNNRARSAIMRVAEKCA